MTHVIDAAPIRETPRVVDVEGRRQKLRERGKSDGDGVTGADIAAGIPDVFRRMLIETLEKYARHGVVGARQELRPRQAEQVKRPAQGERKRSDEPRSKTPRRRTGPKPS